MPQETTQRKRPPAKKAVMAAPASPLPAMPSAPTRRQRIDRRILMAGAVLLGVAVLFLLANSVFFVKRISHQFSPPKVAPTPEGEVDPYLLQLAGTPDRLLIPSLGIEAPLVESATRSQAAYKAALQQGVSHFPGTAEAGGAGNAYFFGHSSDLPWAPGDYKTVFALLPEIEIGARIYVTDRDGNAFAYFVDGTKVVQPNDLSVLASENGKRTLTLQTSYPIGTALRRFIVTASFEAEVLVR